MSSASEPTRLPTGALFADRYIVEAPLGAGGMGAVYRVRDTFVGEVIALKLAAVEPDDAGQAGSLWELQRSEVALARRVTHPHVARVFDLGRYAGTPYITMAYVPGRSLYAALRDQELGVVDIVRVGHHVASALAAAHAAGVLHLDLKPENIVLTDAEPPSATLVDFGIARTLGSPSLGMGTADYIAPEQLERLPLTGAADVFALGCVLHVALSGGYPFAGRSRQQRMRARLTDPPLPLPEQVPAELSALVFRCLAREPGQRPTAAALERAFVELLVRFEPAVAPCDDNRSAGVPAARTVDLGAFAGGLGRRLAGARHKLLRIGREGEALVELDDILAVEPDLDVALSLRALALVRLWNRSHSAAADERNALAEKATQAVADARARAAHLADTHLADALIADYAGDTAYAVRALRRAHAHEPLHAFSHEVLGRIELEGCVGGVDRLLLAHELDPRQLGALSVVAREYFFTGRDDEAHALLARLESSRQWNNLEAMTMQLRLCLWRRDAGTAQELLRKAPKAGVIAVQLLFDCAAALGGAFSAVELAERAAHAVDQSMTSKRKSFVHQLAAEGLAALSPDEALCHVVSAARLPLSDLRWLDACPALAPLRRAPPFVEARAAVQERVDRAFALPAVSGSPDRDTRAATVRVVDAAAPTTTSGVFARLSPTVKTPSSRPSRPSRPSRTPRSGRTARTVKTDPPRR